MSYEGETIGTTASGTRVRRLTEEERERAGTQQYALDGRVSDARYVGGGYQFGSHWSPPDFFRRHAIELAAQAAEYRVAADMIEADAGLPSPEGVVKRQHPAATRATIRVFAHADAGLLPVEIVFEHGEFYGVWVNDDLDDSVECLEDWIDTHGDECWESLETFRTGPTMSMRKLADQAAVASRQAQRDEEDVPQVGGA